jgi:hypothetical protein
LHEIVIVGVVVVAEVLLPQELRIAGTAINAKEKRKRCQHTVSRPHRKFDSNTRSLPARVSLIFLRKIQILPREQPPDAKIRQKSPVRR